MRIEIYPSHDVGRKQNWHTLDDDICRFVDRVVDDTSERLARVGFVGAYLHGSLAMSSFYRPKSDIDLLFVVEHPMQAELRREVALAFCDLSDARMITGDLEISVVRRCDVVCFHHPLPYELHYGEEHKRAMREGRVDYDANNSDPDLAVYCTIIGRCGICIRGMPIAQVFGSVPIECYRDSILADLDWILEGDHICQSPFYAVLNCCRVLALNEEGWDKTLNKEEGGEWGLHNLPDSYKAIISQALACYRSPRAVSPDERRTDGHGWNNDDLRKLRDYVKSVLTQD